MTDARLSRNTDFQAGTLPPGLIPAGFDQVYFNDNFAEGLAGWQDHSSWSVNGLNWEPPISLSTQRTLGSAFSMKLSTSAQRSSGPGGSTGTYRRMARDHEDGYLMFLAQMAYRSTANLAAPKNIMMGIDTQKWDESSRLFSKLIFERFVGQPDTYAPRWVITNDAGDYVEVPNAVMADPAAPVAGKGSVFGWNENKAGFFTAGLVVDLGGSGGLGAYHRAVIGNKWFNLTGLGAGRGAQPPQNSSQTSGATSYAGGLNFGFSVSNRAANDDGPAQLFITQAVGLHYPAGTEFPS